MLFDTSLYRFDEPQPSWWEAAVPPGGGAVAAPLAGTARCDVAIIGGGYTGLSAAYHLARDHHLDVMVLEAGHFGWGASGRNGGFCCIGGTMQSDRRLVRRFGVDEVRRYYDAQKTAVELVRSIAEDERIDIEAIGQCEMTVAEKPEHFAGFRDECTYNRETLGVDCRIISREEFAETRYDAPHQHGAIAISPGFGLNPLKYCQGLARAAAVRGARLHSHSRVKRWQKDGADHALEVEGGATVRASQVIVACNGFMPENLGSSLAGRTLPLQSHVVVTRPLTDSELAAHNWNTFDPAVNSRNVYFYYRMLPENRLLIGGRSDFVGRPSGAARTERALHRAIGRLWPEWRDVGIEHSWRGLVCFTMNLRPAIGRLPEDPSVYLAYGYHGNGVNTATWAGREIANWLALGNDRGNPVPTHLPAIVRGVSKPFPFPGLRRQYARAGVAWHRLLDMLEGTR